MSYSGYGGYAWKNGFRYKEAEDATLTGVIAPEERPLERRFGLKFDVLLHAYVAQGIDYNDPKALEEIDWTKSPHHVVLVPRSPVALLGYKQSVSVVIDGKKLKVFPDGHDYDPYEKGEQVEGRIKGYRYAIKGITYPHSEGCMMLLETPDETIYTGVVGYGIGDHFWKDEQGREYLYPGERKTEDIGWQRISEELEREDMQEYGVDSIWSPIGFKDQTAWSTYQDWERRVNEWVEAVLSRKG